MRTTQSRPPLVVTQERVAGDEHTEHDEHDPDRPPADQPRADEHQHDRGAQLDGGTGHVPTGL